jgi:hypothetical protein
MRKLIFRTVTALTLLLTVAALNSTKTVVAKKGPNHPISQFTYDANNHSVGFSIDNASSYQLIDYSIVYTHDGSNTGAITGRIDNYQRNNQVSRDNLYLGTCSSGGTCIDHNVESSIQLTLIFSKSQKKLINHYSDSLSLDIQ